MNTNTRDPLAVYVHIPFCKSKCLYCDFNSYAGMESFHASYFDALNLELTHYISQFEARGIRTIFFGGGTPTAVDPKYLTTILSKLKPYLASPDAEVTFECNPGAQTSAQMGTVLVVQRNAGFNRISVGLQSANGTELKALGRIHNFAEFVETFNEARTAGFEDINVDLMFGIPGQTLESWRATLSAVLSLRPTHVSAYGLKVEEGTPFWALENEGRLLLPDDSEERQMYSAAVETLASAGYAHYEISNWSLPGRECKHNLVYWTCGEYIGLGAGAHSYLDGVRFSNISAVPDYIATAPTSDFADGMPDCVDKDEIYPIDSNEQMREFMLLGLRLNIGVSDDEFQARFGVLLRDVFGAELGRLEAQGLVENAGGRVVLTTKGLDFANLVFMEFV